MTREPISYRGCNNQLFRRKSQCLPGMQAGWRSGAGFVNHLFPDAFGAEDEFDEFAGGAFAAIGFGGEVGGAADFRGGVVEAMARSTRCRMVSHEEDDAAFSGPPQKGSQFEVRQSSAPGSNLPKAAAPRHFWWRRRR